MISKLTAGKFYGTQSRSQLVADIRLTESWYSPAFRIPRHSHESAYFGLVLEGSYAENYETKTRQCSPFTLLFHPADEVHSECHEDILVRILSIEFPFQWRERLIEHSTILDAPGQFYSGPLVRLALRLYQEFKSCDALSPLVIEGLMLEIVAGYCREKHIQEPRIPHWLQQVKELLHDQFANTPSLEQIAQIVDIHPAHLSRAFHQHYDCTLGDYVRNLRIEQSRHDLANTNVALSEIALAAGYSDQSHFTNAFKRHTGQTPAQFRKLFQKR